MKYKKLLFGFFITLLSCHSMKGQVFVDIAQDTLLMCAGFDTLLGNTVTVLGGMPPYTYSWSAQLLPNNNWGETFPLSQFTNDTTLLNPTFYNYLGDGVNTLYLSVTDAQGTHSKDSLVLITSSAIGQNLFFTYNISVNDTVPIEAPYFITSSHSPLTYSWEPTYGIIDPNEPYTFATPDTSIEYTVVLINKWGCVFKKYPTYFFNVTIPVGSHEHLPDESDFFVYPNPCTSPGYLQVNPAINGKFKLYTTDGKVVTSGNVDYGTLYLKNTLPDNLYLLEITDNENFIKHIKIQIR